ncbi:MAG: hypothetical protein F6K14_21560 [Symploca sp. SIO2C1]|nr:hypothetical protein [Symploca sp. SIO2C1]
MNKKLIGLLLFLSLGVALTGCPKDEAAPDGASPSPTESPAESPSPSPS